MTDVIRIFTERGDLAHLALLMWAGAASAAAWRLLRELTAAMRRFDDFVRELQSFNRRAGRRPHVAADAGNDDDDTRSHHGYTTVANASWSWGSIGYVASGAAGAFAASNPSDALVDLIYALWAGYRQNATFVMNRRTQDMVRKFTDSTGTYLWQPPATASGCASRIGRIVAKFGEGLNRMCPFHETMRLQCEAETAQGTRRRGTAGGALIAAERGVEI
ncbi:MAG: Phage major capsid protein [Tardiphaga sp.]|nr:Phage major capsid protein [Tardiphaga sp.]